ncbi:hypothetical protein RJ641_032334 [Dillenia turbinata]|uniref:Uncharacterized protein n=1 Tax=Dillenia turbinata TaxID=194707 RepID=A0AAN8VZA8_9MAGN
MGSLMAGWDSPVLDPKRVKFQRNWSLTKGEIEAYWKSKKETEEEHLRDIYGSPNSTEEKIYTSTRKYQRSSSLPKSNTKERFMEMEGESNLEQFINIKNSAWWTRSTSAHLNEPPVIGSEGGPSYKYASQYHVSDMTSFKPESSGGFDPKTQEVK